MKLAWAKLKPAKQLLPVCCDKIYKQGKEVEGTNIIVDISEVIINPSRCMFCGTMIPDDRCYRMINSPFEGYNLAFIFSIDIAEGEFDPNVVPESNFTV